MALDNDPRTPDLTHAKNSVLPMIVLLVVVFGAALVAYRYWPEFQQVFSIPTPSGDAPAASPPTPPAP
jgi:hypothetical protein